MTVCEWVCECVGSQAHSKNAFVFPGLLPIAGRGGKTALSLCLLSLLVRLCLSSPSLFTFWDHFSLKYCYAEPEARHGMCKYLKGWRQFVPLKMWAELWKGSQIRQQLWMIEAPLLFVLSILDGLSASGLVCANCDAISSIFAEEENRISLSWYIMWEVCIHDMCRLSRLDSCVGYQGWIPVQV